MSDPSQRPTQRPMILCVDDDPDVLEGLNALLRRRFLVQTAPNGAAGLEELEKGDPFQVVLSDMRMPGMDGATFLAAVRERYPDTTRLLLTGHAEVPAAVAAVNEGGIYRFLTKPCPPEQLLEAVQQACLLYQMRTAEKELLEKTLTGAVAVLSEVMSLAAPNAFGRSHRIQRSVRWVIEEMGLSEPWRYELAAMLSQIGLVGVDDELIRRANAGYELTAEEKAEFDTHPDTAKRLLGQIPRLAVVSHMVANQCRDVSLPHSLRALERNDAELLGGQVLRAAIALDGRIESGEDPMDALEQMRRVHGVFNPKIVDALIKVYEARSRPTASVMLDDLTTGMIFLAPVRTEGGVIVVPKGHEVSPTVKARLLRFAQGRKVREPLLVQMPEPSDAEALATARQLAALV